MLLIKALMRRRVPLVVARRETYDGPSLQKTEAGETTVAHVSMQVSIKAIAGPLLAVLLLGAGASPAAAQISIPLPGGSGGSIQIGPQPDQRYQDPNRAYGGAASIRILGAVYGGNCAGQANSN